MIRPMTSNVSALSGIVANGHQAIHFVSSTPSKIPDGGFSPVRLQTRLTRRPPSRACPRSLIGRHCRYLVSRRLIRSGSCDQSAPRTSDHDRESSGPWLPTGCIVQSARRLLWPHLRLCRPPGGLCIIPSGCGTSPPAAEGPQFTLPVHSPRAVTRTPVLPRVRSTMSSSWTWAFAVSALARQPQTLALQNQRGLA